MYNKLFTKILDSSIWLAPDPHRLVWITLIAAMDEHGNAMFASAGNLAARARVTRGQAEEAVASFEGPDPDSGDPDNDGRRIERFPGGWHVLNAHKYRALVTKSIIQAQTRARVARHRAKAAGVTLSNAPVTNEQRTGNASVTPSVALALSTSTLTSTPKAKTPRKREAPSCPDGVTEETWADWLTLRKAKRAPVTDTVIREAGAEAGKAGMSLEAFLRVWCARGSQGLQADWLKPSERGNPETISKYIKGTSLDTDFLGYPDDDGGLNGNAASIR